METRPRTSRIRTIDPNPETDEDWPSFAGDAGHANYVPEHDGFDGDDLEVAWSLERHAGSVAVADDTVFTGTADGVVALDAADGSVVWEHDDRNLVDPAVAGDTVYFRSREVDEDSNGNRTTDHDELVALDFTDGSVRWEIDFDGVGTPTVAYGSVFVFSGGTLYALDTDDGSIRWESESITIEAEDDNEYDLFGGQPPRTASSTPRRGTTRRESD